MKKTIFPYGDEFKLRAETQWKLAEVIRLWEQYRVVSATGMEVQGVHAYIDVQLKRVEAVLAERAEWKERALAAERRLDNIAEAIGAHLEDK